MSQYYLLQNRSANWILEPTDGEDKITNHDMKEMRKQLTMTPKDILESIKDKEYQKTIRKIKEIED